MLRFLYSLCAGAPWNDYRIVKQAKYDAISNLLARYDNVAGANKLLSTGNIQAKGEDWGGRSILTYAISLVSNEVRDILASNKPIDIETVGGSGHRVSEVVVTMLRIYDHCAKYLLNVKDAFQSNCHAMLQYKMNHEWGGEYPSVESMEAMIMAFVDNYSIGDDGTCNLRLPYHCEYASEHFYLKLLGDSQNGSEISFSKEGDVTIIGDAAYDVASS